LANWRNAADVVDVKPTAVDLGTVRAYLRR
jgi:hypothetical protein